jgi:hypothetical protein
LQSRGNKRAHITPSEPFVKFEALRPGSPLLLFALRLGGMYIHIYPLQPLSAYKPAFLKMQEYMYLALVIIIPRWMIDGIYTFYHHHINSPESGRKHLKTRHLTQLNGIFDTVAGVVYILHRMLLFR